MTALVVAFAVSCGKPSEQPQSATGGSPDASTKAAGPAAASDGHPTLGIVLVSDLTIPDEEAEEIATVGDAIDYLEEKVA